LKKICQHPFLLPEFEPERPGDVAAAQHAAGADAAAAAAAADAEYLAALISGSAKMLVLDVMLQQLRADGKQVLVMAHTPRVSWAAAPRMSEAAEMAHHARYKDRHATATDRATQPVCLLLLPPATCHKHNIDAGAGGRVCAHQIWPRQL
jgi:hypothetical protein